MNKVEVAPEAHCRCPPIAAAEYISVGLCACVDEPRLPGMGVLRRFCRESADEVEQRQGNKALVKCGGAEGVLLGLFVEAALDRT